MQFGPASNMDSQKEFFRECDMKQCKNTAEKLLKFNIDNQDTFWIDKKKNFPTLPKMLNDIENWLKNLQTKAGTSEMHGNIFKDFRFETLHAMIFYTSKGEGEGISTIEVLDRITKSIIENSSSEEALNRNEKISHQIGRAILHLRKTSESLQFRILTPDFISEVHRVLMVGLMSECSSEEGEYRKKEAFTMYNNGIVKYEDYEKVEPELCNLCDQYNAMLIHLLSIIQKSRRPPFKMVFKCAAWFVIQFLKIHPYSDGNGRTARLIASYILGIISPIEIPIYNIYSKSLKDDYVKAVRLGQENDKNQGLLAIMIIESCWHMYCTLNQKLNKF